MMSDELLRWLRELAPAQQRLLFLGAIIVILLCEICMVALVLMRAWRLANSAKPETEEAGSDSEPQRAVGSSGGRDSKRRRF